MHKENIHFWFTIDRWLSSSRWIQLVLLVGVFGMAYIFSYVLLLSFAGKESNFTDPFFLLFYPNTLDAFLKKDPVSIQSQYIETVAACFIYFLGIVIFGGMLISLISNMISRRVENHQNGLTHYLKRNHVVIMGYDDMVPSIIINVCSNSDSYVLLMSSVKTEIIREKIRRSAASIYTDRIVFNYGHRTHIADLKTAHVESAKIIYIVGNRSLPAHDSMNVECIQSIGRYFKDLTNNGRVSYLPSSIYCVFEDFDTYSAFQTTDIIKDLLPKNVSLVPYNFYHDWSKKILVNRSYTSNGTTYPPLDRDGIKYNDDTFVHLIIVGTSTFGTSIAVEASKILHFPNFDRNNDLKTKITFIDVNADEEINLFRTRNHNFFEIQSSRLIDMTLPKTETTPIPPTVFSGKDNSDFLDVDIEFIKGDVFSDMVRSYLSECSTNENEYLSIILAMSNQQRNFAIAMNMPSIVYERAIPIFIRQDKSSDLVTILHDTSEKMGIVTKHQVKDGKYNPQEMKGRYANIYPFGMTEIGLDHDLITLMQAKLFNYLYYTAFEEKPITYRLKDIDVLKNMDLKEIKRKADEEWQKLSVAKQWSNLYCAYNIPYRMNSLRAMRNGKEDNQKLTDDEIKILGVVEHNRWNVEKLMLGFRKPLPEEDIQNNKAYLLSIDKYNQETREEMKDKLLIHHDIRPFHGLDEIQELDREIVRYIPWIVETANKITKIND